MLDLSRLSVEPHVRKAILKHKLVEGAQARVSKGVSFLDEHAPREWRLSMMSIHEGVVSSRVRMAHNDENPLALAFRHEIPLRNPDGRVTWGTVRNKFRFTEKYFQELGLLEMNHPCGTTLVTTDIDCKLLDFAWAEALKNFEWRPQPYNLFNLFPKVA